MTTSMDKPVIEVGKEKPALVEDKNAKVLELEAKLKLLSETDVEKASRGVEDPTRKGVAMIRKNRLKAELIALKAELAGGKSEKNLEIKVDSETIKLGKDALFLENSIKNLKARISSLPAESSDPREKMELDAELKSDQEQFNKVVEVLKAKGITFSDVPKILETKALDTPKVSAEKVSEKSVESPAEAELEVSPDDEDDAEGPLTIKRTGFFSRLSARGKNFLARVWDKVPQTKGKLHAGVFQFLINREQNKFAEVKTEMDTLDMSIHNLNKAKIPLLANMKMLSEKGLPGAEVLHVQVKKLESDIEGFVNKKNALASKLKRKMDTVRGNENERTIIATRFREGYEDKLRPMDKELERFKGLRTRLDKENEAFEKRANEQLKQIADFEASKSQIEDALRLAGKSEWLGIKRNGAVKAIEKQIADMRSRIQGEKQVMMEKYTAINANIADVDARANPYRDRMEAFALVSKRESITMNVPKRITTTPYEGIKDVYPDTRIDPTM